MDTNQIDEAVVIEADGSTTAMTVLRLPQLPDAAELLAPANLQLTVMKAVTIASDDDRAMVLSDVQDIKEAMTSIEAQRVAITGPVNAKLKEVNDVFRPAREAYEKAEQLGKAAMLAYDREQARIAENKRQEAVRAAAAEQARIAREAAEAQARADAETKRLQDIADKAAAEAKAAEAAGDAAAAAAAQEVVQAAAAAVTEVKVEAQAVAVEAQATSQAVASSALHMLTPVARTGGGSGKRAKWTATVTDKATALAYIAARPELHNLLEFNESAVNKLADAQREGFNLPGMQAVQEIGLSVRKRAS